MTLDKNSFESNPILKMTFSFSLDILSYCDELNNAKRYVLSQQLCKSGTSIGANSNEAQDAESKADFIHKFKIAAKEVRETKYWLQLCKQAPQYPACDLLIDKLNEIERVINKIISSAKRSQT